MSVCIGIAMIWLVLSFLAWRYGYDSCDGVRSEEETLAAYGMRWPDQDDARLAQQLAAQLDLARQQRVISPVLDELDVAWLRWVPDTQADVLEPA